MSRALEIGLSPTVGSSQRLYSAPTHASPHRCLPAKTETTRPEDKEMSPRKPHWAWRSWGTVARQQVVPSLPPSCGAAARHPPAQGGELRTESQEPWGCAGARPL